MGASRPFGLLCGKSTPPDGAGQKRRFQEIDVLAVSRRLRLLERTCPLAALRCTTRSVSLRIEENAVCDVAKDER
jgi:hypothetical protein